ncbi:MAG: type II 3-dehydroquinate dehydratase [Syntrophomonadaceae bacterium]|nr:type II 3-dehydroquinate dehydratase [Syntrophomonadaceae bacterium]
MKDMVLVINGPNLNMLGQREPGIYGDRKLEDINDELRELAGELNIEVEFFQSNHEGALVDRIQAAIDDAAVIIINAGAFTHYSIAIHDALRAVNIPVIEVHLSNIYQREEFRHNSMISPAARGGIFGFGFLSYKLAILAAREIINGGID